MIKDSSKTIVCYGDSNTWGAVPNSDERYPRSIRWPSMLQTLLGDDYEVISEGLSGRTLVVPEPNKAHRTGITHLQSILESADPVDLLIIMLGTNDIKSTFNISPEEIAEHLDQTISFIKNLKSNLLVQPEILVICPPQIVQPDGELDYRMVRGLELFKELPDLYRKVAEKYGCSFINAQDYISSGKIDGYHLDADAHKKLAEIIEKNIKNESL